MSPSGARAQARPWWLSKWWSPGDGLLKQLVLVPVSAGLSIFVTSSKSGWLSARASYVGLGDHFLPIFNGAFCFTRRLS